MFEVSKFVTSIDSNGRRSRRREIRRASRRKPDVEDADVEDAAEHVGLTPTALNIFVVFYQNAMDGEMAPGSAFVLGGFWVSFLGRTFDPARSPCFS